ncbi:hypothetical protein BD414DRAFT_493673 [Trametes punicea]|nr:hypothetical protein BD414DRAFT_493673 [Trametes punicea]
MSERLVTIPLQFVQISATESNSGNVRQFRVMPSPTRCEPPQGTIAFELTYLSPKRASPSSAIGLMPCSASFIAKSSPSRRANDILSDVSTSALDSAGLPSTVTRASAHSQSSEDEATGHGFLAVSNGDEFKYMDVPPLDEAAATFASSLGGTRCNQSFGASDVVDCAETQETRQPSLAAPSTLLKPMRSLVSLMDDFREIARSATQKSLMSIGVGKPRPRPRNCGLAPEPFAANCVRPVTTATSPNLAPGIATLTSDTSLPPTSCVMSPSSVPSPAGQLGIHGLGDGSQADRANRTFAGVNTSQARREYSIIAVAPLVLSRIPASTAYSYELLRKM